MLLQFRAHRYQATFKETENLSITVRQEKPGIPFLLLGTERFLKEKGTGTGDRDRTGDKH